jgi:hypothetical protein
MSSRPRILGVDDAALITQPDHHRPAMRDRGWRI